MKFAATLTCEDPMVAMESGFVAKVTDKQLRTRQLEAGIGDLGGERPTSA